MDKRHLSSVDFWKGITILSVLNMHTCFWSGCLYLPEWTRQASLLIDIPVFFFISGFLIQGTGPKEVLGRGARQCRRLLTDYGVVVITALAVAAVLLFLLGMITTPNLRTIAVSALKLDPQWLNFPVFGPSMWFLQIYVSLLPFGIAILALPQKKACIVALAGTLAAFIFIQRHYPQSPSFLFSDLRSVTCYFSLFLAGAFFKTVHDRISLGAVLSAWLFLGIVTLLACYQNNSFPNLQQIKFPPTKLHLLFAMNSVMMACVLIVLETQNRFPAFSGRTFSFISWCGANVFRIYLWQGFATSIPYMFVPNMLKSGLPAYAVYCAALAWNILASVALALCHNRFEAGFTALKKTLRGRTDPDYSSAT